MTSGIYRLTFSSGKYYIGKSLDIETRWKQHFNKFALGKAARPMQLEFDRYGPPQTEVIFPCHKDHIDLMEEWLIDQFKGPDMLNTTYPDIERTQEVCELIRKSISLLGVDTWTHLRLIHNYVTELETAEEAIDEAEERIQKYKREGYLVDDDCREMVDIATKATKENHKYLTELQRLKHLSLWDRIWNYSVNV